MKGLDHSQVPNSLQVDQFNCRYLMFQAIHNLLVTKMTFPAFSMCPHWPTPYQENANIPQQKNHI